ncbi:MAG: hypothetical protein AAF525_14905 [Pseudomonadota bacterium]
MAISQSQARNRLWLLILCPLVLVVVAGNLLLWYQLSSAQTARTELMGETISAQLALSLREPMVRGEHLTINVMLNDLLTGSQDLVTYAAVYNNSNTLIAQAGTPTPTLTQYSQRISYQQSVIGRLEIGLGYQPGYAVFEPLLTLIATQLMISAMIMLIVIQLRDAIMFWLYPDLPRDDVPTSAAPSASPDGVATASDPSSLREDGTLMVVRPIPVNLDHEIIELLASAVSLCRGDLTMAGSGDLELLFQSDQHEQDAVCCAALLMELVAVIPRPYSAHFALHYCTDCQVAGGQFTEARKFTNYLTAIAGGKILISHTLAPRVPDTLGVQLSSFSHTALPNGQAMVMVGSSRAFQNDIRQRLVLLTDP